MLSIIVMKANVFRGMNRFGIEEVERRVRERREGVIKVAIRP